MKFVLAVWVIRIVVVLITKKIKNKIRKTENEDVERTVRVIHPAEFALR